MNGVTDVRYRVVVNASGNANYPFVLSDGVTVYYASDGEGLGGYDILSLATTRIPTLILFRKCGYAVQLAVQ